MAAGPRVHEPARAGVATGAAIAEACGIGAESIDQLNDVDYGAWRMKSMRRWRLRKPHFTRHGSPHSRPPRRGLLNWTD